MGYNDRRNSVSYGDKSEERVFFIGLDRSRLTNLDRLDF